MSVEPRGPTTEELRARALAHEAMLGDADYTPGPGEDWYCNCREPAPDRIGTIAVLRPARQSRCGVCFTDAPWSALREPPLDSEGAERQ